MSADPRTDSWSWTVLLLAQRQEKVCRTSPTERMRDDHHHTHQHNQYVQRRAITAAKQDPLGAGKTVHRIRSTCGVARACHPRHISKYSPPRLESDNSKSPHGTQTRCMALSRLILVSATATRLVCVGEKSPGRGRSARIVESCA